MSDSRVGQHSSQHQPSALLTPSNAIKQLECPTDHKLFQAIRRQLNGSDHHHHHHSHHPEQSWIREFLALGGWDYLLDALKFHSQNSGKNGESALPAPHPAAGRRGDETQFSLETGMTPRLSNQSRWVDEQHSRTTTRPGLPLVLRFLTREVEQVKFARGGSESRQTIKDKYALLLVFRPDPPTANVFCCQNI